jgi:tetratricopeptide (TPR) repeat protein
MNFLKYFFLFLILFSFHNDIFSQDKIDSLISFIKTAREDTSKVNTLGHITEKLRRTGDYEKAMLFAKQEMALAEKLDFKIGIPIALTHIGIIYYKQGDYVKGLFYFFKALKIDEELGDKNGIAADLGNIGVIYRNQKNYFQALKYYFKALKIAEELNDKYIIANNISNIGNVYNKQGNYQKALDYYFKALEIDKGLKDKGGIAYDYNNIGNIYDTKGEYDKSLTYFIKSLEIKKEINDKKGMSISLINIAGIYSKKNKFSEALEYFSNALKIARQIGSKDDIKESYLGISEVYSKTNNCAKSFEYYKLYSEIKDSLFSDESSKQVAEVESKYNMEKKDHEIELLNKEKEKQVALSAEQNRRQQLIIVSTLAGLALALVFAIFIFRSNRQKQRINTALAEQNIVIEDQKKTVELKNKSITDSIIYAKRIQQAILPPIKLVEQKLPESFILYEPKDIVAGDFYWMEISGDNIFLAAADCTGHGVPGAMVSVVCANALNRAVKEFGITDPGKILDKARMLVLETFEKSESEVKDGMDISLCVLNKKENKIFWAGANNPIWYLENNELKEITANKQSIGKTDNPKPFTTHTLSLAKGDSIYLFTDGYADQFGGPQGKKLKYKLFKDVIVANSSGSMKEQHDQLNNILNDWKGDLEQVDDILIIGVRL